RGNLIHALADADARGKMKHRLHAGQRALHDEAIAHVAGYQLDIAMQIRRPGFFTVYLRQQFVEHANLVSVLEEMVGQVGSNKAGPTGDEDSHDDDALCNLCSTPTHGEKCVETGGSVGWAECWNQEHTVWTLNRNAYSKGRKTWGIRGGVRE